MTGLGNSSTDLTLRTPVLHSAKQPAPRTVFRVADIPCEAPRPRFGYGFLSITKPSKRQYFRQFINIDVLGHGSSERLI